VKFPFYKQLDQKDCGPTCLRMISKFYGRSISLQTLREKTNIGRQGVSLLSISHAAESIGLRTIGTQLTIEKLAEDAPLPCILHWNQNHFVVLYEIKQSRKGKYSVSIADPVRGLITLDRKEFEAGWISIKSDEGNEGIALLMTPQPEFFDQEEEQAAGIGFKRLLSYLSNYKKLIVQLFLGLFIGSLLQLVFPFLTQSIVDIGINTQNLNFIYVILFAQLMLFAGRTSIEFIRSWILLHISARINISILSDFFIKLMRLPLGYFDVKLFGDWMQRIQDHHRIETFLTQTTLNTLFSLFSLVVFGIVLAFYNIVIFVVFAIASILYFGWVLLFLEKRRVLDVKRFRASAKNQSAISQLINGMQEIKLANSETQKRWEWERIQARLFKLNIKGLALIQYQTIGTFFLNEGKNIFITFYAAKLVIDGDLTLGAMLALQYIIGQMNGPIDQLSQLIQTTQDAKISLERLNEIHELKDEESSDHPNVNILPVNKSIALNNISFHYPGESNIPVLKNVSLFIPEGKTTAIVGMSGSGKTTLLKLLLKFYEPGSGEILVGESQLYTIRHQLWRSHCGVVMQDGFIFSTSIAQNIAVGEDFPDLNRLIHAADVANIFGFIESLPMGFNTQIGMEGKGLSQGQKQRILIARAVYKNPSFILFDEATNALDATNESIIMRNLERFFKGKTVIVVAHRLSTVKNADQIIVLDKGEIVEYGTHDELARQKGNYFHLVRNQLELGN
jgi:ATP-binding cassette subfamily B protein